jgi:ankyrin repeat protein/tellurite resistance protein
MAKLDPKGPAHTAVCESRTYELHMPNDTHLKALAAFDAARTMLWTVPIEVGECMVHEMIVEREPTTNRLLLTLDGVHWKGGTRLTHHWLIAADGTLASVLGPGDFAELTEVQRRALLTMLVLAASADGNVDPREIALVRPLLESKAWRASNQVFAADLQHAQERARAIRTPAEVAELGRASAIGFSFASRELFLSLLFAIAWADGAVRPEEQWVISAFAQGLGHPGERVNALADMAADVNIFAATARGRIDAVRRLLDAGTSVMTRDPRDWTPLHVAVASGKAAIVDLLLERGADVHAKHGQGSPPLFLACNKPYEAIVERLLRAGARPDEAGAGGLNPLLIAAMFGQTGVARALRGGGASLEVRDADSRTPLHAAAQEGRSGVVAFLLAEGAAVDARTNPACTPLMFAVEHGDLATVTALLAAKADVHAVDIDQQTPLHYAMLGNRPEVVALLLAFGARADAPAAKQVTPLHVAAGAGYTTSARLLLDAGAPVDAKNIEGGTPLFMAAVRDRREVYELLVARGANLDAPTSFDTTPRGSVGVGLAIKALRGESLAEPLAAGSLRPDDATLAAHDDYQIAMWMNAEGSPDQVLVAGTDAKGRPSYVGRAASGDPRGRFFALTDKSGKRWLPVFTTDAAAEAFRRALPQVGWPEGGVGLARAVTGSANAKVIFAIGDLPIDGVVLNPFGPSGPIHITAEECDRIARRAR